MISIIKYKLSEQFKSVCYYFAGLFLYTWMIIGLFPSVAKLKDDYAQQMPENMLKIFGAEGAQSMGTIEGFISMEFLSLFFVLILAFFVGSSAGSTLAGAAERKTLDFGLSQPISRTKFLLAGAAVTVFYIVLLTLLTAVSMLLLGKIYNAPFDSQGMAAFFVVASCLLLAFYGIAILLSSRMKSKLSVAGGTVMILIAFYILTAMTRIVDKIKDYDKYSLFYAYNPQKLLESGDISWYQTGVLFAIFIIGLLSSIVIFNKKDL